MSDANGKDLTQFERWYTQAGTPTVTAEGTLDAAAGTYSLTLSQTCGPSPGQDAKKPFHIPIKVRARNNHNFVKTHEYSTELSPKLNRRHRIHY